ncbi:MAG: hypothetical protein V4622_10205 [Bacteroidota bacterium]
MKELIEKAINLIRQDEDKKAIEILSSKSLENNGEANHLLGNIYFLAEKGISDIKKDKKKGIEFWNKAVKLKNSESAYELGNIYLLGSGVKTNKKLAKEYYKLGYEFKTYFYEFCGLELVDIYISENKFEKAIKICENLIDQNKIEENCLFRLYKIHSDSNNISKNSDLAIEYLEKAVLKKHVPSCFKLAQILSNGVLIEKDIIKAISILEVILENKDDNIYHNDAISKIEGLKKELKF